MASGESKEGRSDAKAEGRMRMAVSWWLRVSEEYKGIQDSSRALAGESLAI